jgi:hypothetical protein
LRSKFGPGTTFRVYWSHSPWAERGRPWLVCTCGKNVRVRDYKLACNNMIHRKDVRTKEDLEFMRIKPTRAEKRKFIKRRKMARSKGWLKAHAERFPLERKNKYGRQKQIKMGNKDVPLSSLPGHGSARRTEPDHVLGPPG